MILPRITLPWAKTSELSANSRLWRAKYHTGSDRPPEEARRKAAARAKIKADPEAALAALMKADLAARMAAA